MPETLPAPSELTRPFWDAAARHVLVRQRCQACGGSFFPPRICCPACLSEDLEWAESTGRGTVESFTVCYRGPEPSFAVPYVLAIVALEESWSMLSNIVGCPVDDVAIGQRVRVEWRSDDGGETLPVFEPAAIS